MVQCKATKQQYGDWFSQSQVDTFSKCKENQLLSQRVGKILSE
jgi:hypothetical protein